MKMEYIKPEIKTTAMVSEYVFMENSNGNFDTEIGDGEGTFDAPGNNWGWDWSDDEETTSTSMWEEEEE